MARATTGRRLPYGVGAPGRWRKRWSTAVRLALGAWTIGGAACGGVADEGKLPPDVQDPARLKTPSGAIARYRGALAALPEALDAYLTTTGILTDELADSPTPVGVSGDYTGIDSRTDLRGFEPEYNKLHFVRGQAREARGFLQAYAPDSSPSLAGHLYTLEGYAEVLLADLFCSGIPLSTVNFNGDYTFAAGSSTTDVYRHAIALFDTALTMESDSLRFQYFTAVARGRALLALGRYAEGAEAVTAVPDDYKYQMTFIPVPQRTNSSQGSPTNRLLYYFVGDLVGSYRQVAALPGMADREGVNGFDYRSSGDSRTPTKLEGNDVLGHPYYFPSKYPDQTANVALTLADGVEARLIEAEAALQAGDVTTWLAKLNHLRETAISPALPDTTDPGTPEARVDLLFRERAFWLYLTGHRQGDLRRLVRVYLRSPNDVYPTGSYPGGPGSYGDQFVAPVPVSEQNLNPNYTGCLNTNE